MLTTLTIRDESTVATAAAPLIWTLSCPYETLTAEALVRLRVRQEVEDFNELRLVRLNGLVELTPTERVLNGTLSEAPARSESGRGPRRASFAAAPTPQPIDWRIHAERAVEAFRRQVFFLLVDDRQVTRLDEELVIGPTTEVTFLKLVPLVGG